MNKLINLPVSVTIWIIIEDFQAVLESLWKCIAVV